MVSVSEAVDLLRRGPGVVRELYEGLGDAWLHAADPGEWSAHAVLVHMVTVETNAWAHRIAHVLDRPGAMLPAIDRGGPDPARDVGELLDSFEEHRRRNLRTLEELDLGDLGGAGVHQQLGPVTVAEILATWAIHDLNHVSQALAAMASRWRGEVGPFIPNLGILEP